MTTITGKHYEAFCDKSYFDLWRVRRIGDRSFDDGWHTPNRAAAESLMQHLDVMQTEINTLKDSTRPPSLSDFELIGEVGVDSGALMICDPRYVDEQWNNDSEVSNFSLEGCLDVVRQDAAAGQLNYALGHAGVGVAFSSGYGDGTYNVYAKRDAEYIIEVRIIMG